jgi:hypothetical protein
MLKPIQGNENKPKRIYKTTKRLKKQENNPRSSLEPLPEKSPPNDILSTIQQFKANANHSYKYQIISSDNHIIVLKKIKMMAVTF